MKSKVIFRMIAYTDAAGKYNPEAPRNGNEDNFFFSYNLSKEGPSKGEADVDTPLSDCGLLMVIADGMGGMNAGEVASQIAIDTVAEYFAPGKIVPELAATHQKRKAYLEQVISEADLRVKKDSKHNTEHAGMGSTIILAWIVDNELTLSWCGDSRAYRFNPDKGIELLSKDHSYVQELVDKGLIKYEDTFNHPQSNIITRSLGDISKKVIPETKLCQLYENDIILLCSDGLSGVLRDKKTYDSDGELIEGDNLEDIISSNRKSLKKCREALWDAAEKADWYDNVTAILCEIRSGTVLNNSEEETDVNKIDLSHKGFHLQIPLKKLLFCGLFILAFILLCIINPHPNPITNHFITSKLLSLDNIIKETIDSLAKEKIDSLTNLQKEKVDGQVKDNIDNQNESSKEKMTTENQSMNDPANSTDNSISEPTSSKTASSVKTSTDKNGAEDLTEIKEDVKYYTIQVSDNYMSFQESVLNQNPGFKIQCIVSHDSIKIDSDKLFNDYKGKEVIVKLISIH